MSARSALLFGWFVSVLLAAGVGGLVGRLSVENGSPGHKPRFVTRAGATTGATNTDDLLQVVAERARRETAIPQPPALDMSPDPPEEEAIELPTPAPAPKVEPTPAPPPVEVEPEPIEEPAPLAGPALLEQVDRVDRLYESGDLDDARAQAQELVADHPSYTDLVAAFVEGGAADTRARLNALRVLQVAGHDLISRELARELKRSYASTQAVADSIWDWGILSPRILSVESTIERGREVVVVGTLENPDIGAVRRVRVEVEALDAAGNRLAAVEVRVRPKVLGAGETTEFRASFGGLDPATVMRTRATVLRWESELLTP